MEHSKDFLSVILRPRASAAQLEQFAFRVGLSLQSGLSLKQALERESTASYSLVFRQYLAAINKRIAEGESFYQALRECDDFFPALFVELVGIGETTGNLAETLLELAKLYQDRRNMLRGFLGAITPALAELVIALLVIGAFILIHGEITAARGIEADPLGLGLKGRTGFVIYFMIVGILGLSTFFVVRAMVRGAEWVGPFQKLLLRIPLVGKALGTWYLAQIAWALARTLGVGLSVYKAVDLSLRSTRHAEYLEKIAPITTLVRSGASLTEAFRQAGGFPAEFLELMESGESAGELPEAMDRLARQLNEESVFFFRQLSIIGAWLVWALVAGMIIYFIMRLLSYYMQAIGGGF
ncbi:MAG: type II secretion system F family protein [Thermoguttaceae bacterium]|nr:type II secretion system F family protein [Thermoguttaceae bacterium]MDW8078360.1 type II secretion system F family protein [Thermoguttaceae bacterium]